MPATAQTPFPRRRTRLSLALGLPLALAAAPDSPASDPGFGALTDPAHRYWERPLNDRFTALLEEIEEGRVPLDRSSEKGFVAGLLAALEIPPSSQMLVFSTTSLQLRRISTRNPRALYFNEDVYLGWVPGGQVEVVSVDPDLGAVFYIFAPPRGGVSNLTAERSDRCMNCHAAAATRGGPGLLVKSVIPGPNGGSLDAFRRDRVGHEIPLADRFGGWHLTGAESLGEHWGNRVGRFVGGELQTRVVPPGEQFDWSRYPVATSDLLPQLLHEHQAGFINRAVEATYAARYALSRKDRAGRLEPGQGEKIDRLAAGLVRYLLFADEARLPADGVSGDPDYRAAFLQGRRVGPGGRSLKDFDLGTRLFKFRCSYMVYSAAFKGLPPVVKERVFAGIRAALATPGDPGFAYLPGDEKRAIREILEATLPGF